MSELRFNLIWRDGSYYVSKPNIDSMEVVSAANYDSLRARVEALEESLRSGVWTDCKECGLLVEVDEDGCCVTCGRDSIVYSDKARVEALEAENERLRRAVEIVREHQYADSFSTCYDCGWAADDHADDCWIARALRVAEGEEE